MYPSSTSSSSQGPSGGSGSAAGGGGGGGGALFRYGSAPSSIITNAVDSVIGHHTRDFSSLGSHSHTHSHHPQQHHHFGGGAPPRYGGFTSETASESTSKATNNTMSSTTMSLLREQHHQPNNNNNNNNKGSSNGAAAERSSYNMNDMAIGIAGPSSSTPSLVRHSSSPAGFLNQLASAAADHNGFSLTRGMGSYGGKGVSDNGGRSGGGGGGGGLTRLNSQLSFTRQEALSQISEERPWEDANAIMFSVATPNNNKRAKNIATNIVDDLNSMETQFQFGIPQTTLEMATMDKLLHIPQDSVPCKIRAKRGCATHPRSIAERERRTRISGKLKKLQELVPNMDKQTSYADMLDLAVQHIKGLQSQVQKLNKDLEHCTCGCKKSS